MSFLSRTKASVVFLGIMALILAATTIVEHLADSSIALAIYHNPATIALWILLTANWFLIWIKTIKIRHISPGSSLLHLAFAVMLTGSFITMVGETRGNMQLDAGQTKGMVIQDNGRPAGLPFTIGLDSLQISRYPGSGNPSGFTSYVTVTRHGETRKETISVNHPLRLSGWRIYQASYVPETGASVFSLAHDPLGVAVSYTGYALMLLAFLMLMFSPGSRFSRLRRQLTAIGCFALLTLVPAAYANAAETVDWNAVYAQDNRGRIVTLDSFSRELLRKIHHEESIDGMSPSQSLIYLMANPNDIWDKPFLYQKNAAIADMLGQKGKLVAFCSLFDKQGNYILGKFVDEALAIPTQQRSKFQKDILKLDEKANLLYAAVEGLQLPVFPVRGEDAAKWLSPGDELSKTGAKDSAFIRDITSLLLSDTSQKCVDMLADYQSKSSGLSLPSEGRRRQELLSNRIRPFKTAGAAYMSCALLLMVFSLTMDRKNRLRKRLYFLASAATLLVFLLHSWGIGVRWYCSGQAPLSNSYEVTVFLSWCTALLSLALSRRSEAASALGILFSGSLLLVAGMNNMDPSITPLVPVLQSPWLMFHVAVIIAGYGCFGINFLLSLYTLGANAVLGGDSSTVRKTAILVEMFALVGLMLMTIGTFLGAVWAGESWGSYWSWDPKETWALVTVLVYAVCTHSRLVPELNNPKWLCILSVLGFACVLMTYFGVNFFLVGMHSYAR